jgi:hypothetical protein
MARQRQRRDYSDDERAEALAVLDANGGNLSRTAREVGVPRKTLAQWVTGRAALRVADLRQRKKGLLADALEDFGWQVIEALAGRVEQGNLVQLATTLGIAVDKMQLLRGKPTSINNDGLTDVERVVRIAALADAARARRDGPAADGGHPVPAGGGPGPVDAPGRNGS